MNAVNDHLILFGGYFECFDTASCEHVFYNTTYHYHLDSPTGRWEKVCNEEGPSARAYHSSVNYWRFPK
jgi:hypothetical protein